MKGGDLGNELAPTIGIRFERVVKTEEGKLNRSVKAYIENVTRRVGVNVYLITTGDPRRAMAFCTKWAVPYLRVIGAESTLEIPDIVRENDMVAYYDYDKHILQNVNSRGHGKVDAKLWMSEEVS